MRNWCSWADPPLFILCDKLSSMVTYHQNRLIQAGVWIFITTHQNSSFHRSYYSWSPLHSCSDKIPRCLYKRSWGRRNFCPQCTHLYLSDEEGRHIIILSLLTCNSPLLMGFYLTGSEKVFNSWALKVISYKMILFDLKTVKTKSLH